MEFNKIDIEKRAANLLLKRGVKVSVLAPLFFRLFRKKNVEFVITAPTAATLIEISDIFLSMRIEKMDGLTVTEGFNYLKNHSKSMTKIVAVSIINNPRKMWFSKILTWFLSSRLTQEELSYLFHLIVVHGGIEDFINTIRLMEVMTITKPMNLSPEEKMS